jgi:hypothetical protein
MTDAQMEQAVSRLGEQFQGWHCCGALVSRSGHCPNCGPDIREGELLRLDSPWLRWVQRISVQLEDAARRAAYQDRVKAALVAGEEYRRSKGR